MARRSKMSRVEERSSEKWRGVRIGLKVFVAGSWEGKIEMWRGLFCVGGLCGQACLMPRLATWGWSKGARLSPGD